MGVLFRKKQRNTHAMISSYKKNYQRSLAEVLIRYESPGSANSSKHVVIVMDGLKEFTTDPLEWALENVVLPGCVVTLLGAMPWLNLPLFSKTWHDVWAVELEEISIAQEKSEWKSDPKYLKLQIAVDLCKKFGVVLQKEVVMGFPLRLLVVEKITSLHASWVVLDRHQKRDKQFFAKKIPCKMVYMNDNGEADMIRGQPMIKNGDFTPGESPASLIPTPQLIIADNWREILDNKSLEKHEDA